MKAIVSTLEKESGEVFESVVNDVISVVYSNEGIVLVKSNGRSISYSNSNSNKDYDTVICVI